MKIKCLSVSFSLSFSLASIFPALLLGQRARQQPASSVERLQPLAWRRQATKAAAAAAVGVGISECMPITINFRVLFLLLLLLLPANENVHTVEGERTKAVALCVCVCMNDSDCCYCVRVARLVCGLTTTTSSQPTSSYQSNRHRQVFSQLKIALNNKPQ